MRQTVGILGTPIDILDTQAALARLEQFIHEGRFHQVATANTDFLINALVDPELQHILRHADLVMPDGMPVVWAARMTRSRLPERVTGADMVPALAELAARKGYRIYMLGAAPEIARLAKANLEAKHPDIKIVGCVSPPLASLVEMNNQEILDDIVRARPDILLVAFGNPKQEKWIHWNRERLQDVPVCIGVGGTFDFLAGKTQRAPGWMQRTGLEWTHRLVHEPRRLWRRYVRDISQFTRYMFKQWWAIRGGYRVGVSEIYAAQTGDCTVLSLVGDFTHALLPRFQAAAEQAINARTHLILDLQQVTAFDGEALGTLINLPKRAAYHDREVRLVAVPRAIADALRRSQIQEGFFTIVGSVAQAFANGQHAGLSWRVQRGKEAAVVQASGESDARTARMLEKVCEGLLAGGKRVDLDARSIGYADTHLLVALYRLTCAHNEVPNGAGGAARFFVIPGPTLKRALTRERQLGKLALRATPDLPRDAVEQTGDSLAALSLEAEEAKTVAALPGLKVSA